MKYAKTITNVQASIATTQKEIHRKIWRFELLPAEAMEIRVVGEERFVVVGGDGGSYDGGSVVFWGGKRCRRFGRKCGGEGAVVVTAVSEEVPTM